MSAAEVGYIAASGAAGAAITAAGIVAVRVLRPAATAFCDAVKGGYSLTLTVALKPPVPPKDAAEFKADASRFQSALDEALERSAAEVAQSLAASAAARSAAPEAPGEATP